MKKRVYAIIGLIILVLGILTINAAVNKTKAWQSANDIQLLRSGYTMTLQEGIDHNVYLYRATKSYTTALKNPGHDANQIWVSVDGFESTLFQAFLLNDLCGSSSTTSYSNIPSGAYHYANEIEVFVNGAGTMSLQDAIDRGLLCYYDQYTFSWYQGSWGGCLHDPLYYDPTKCIQTRAVYCKTNKGIIISDNDPQRFCKTSKPAETKTCTCPFT